MIPIYGSSAAIAPRSDEELVRLAREGSTRAAEMLLSRYRPLVENKARAYYLIGAEHEDVIQEGMIGLFKAIRDYRDNHMALFRAFADLCVTRHILSAVKAATRCKHYALNFYVSLCCPSGAGGEADSAFIDSLADPRTCDPLEYVTGRSGAAGQIDAIRNQLSALESCVLDAYLEGKSYREMSRELHCQPKAIDNALQRARRKIEACSLPD